MRNAVVVHVQLDNGAEAVYCNSRLIIGQEPPEYVTDCLALAEELGRALCVTPLSLTHPAPVQHPLNWSGLYECLDIPLSVPVLTAGRPIRATLRTLDGRLSCEFDARPWFRQARSELIHALGLADWQASSITAMLVDFVATRDHGVAGVLLHAKTRSSAPLRDGTLTCVVNAAEAMAWCAEFRASIWASLMCARHAIELKQQGADWIWVAPNGQSGNAYSDTPAKAAMYAVHCLQLTEQV